MAWGSKWVDEGEAANNAMKELGVPEIKQIQKDNKTITVTVVGDLGLDFDDEQGWNIYHLSTLATFNKAVPDHNSTSYDKQPLLNWMARVQENYPTSWVVLRCLKPETYLNEGGIAKNIIQKWCLSVKVE